MLIYDSDLINNATVPWWDGFYTYGTTFNLTAALANTSSTDYALLLSDMDAIAKELLILQAANIPVLWRPLHEADGGWFWWGAYGRKLTEESKISYSEPVWGRTFLETFWMKQLLTPPLLS